MIHGLVERPLILTLEELKRYPRVNRIHFMECAANSGMEWRGAQLNGCQFTHGMIYCVQYTGVRSARCLKRPASSQWQMAVGRRRGCRRMDPHLPIEKALDDASRLQDERRGALSGAGLSDAAVVPGWQGNLWVKWLRRIKVGDQPWHTREETSKYTDLLAERHARRNSPG